MKQEHIKKRYMACCKCRGTKFEIYRDECIHDKTPDELKPYGVMPGVSRFRCLGCGLENCTIGVFEHTNRFKDADHARNNRGHVMKPNTNIFGQKICIREGCPAFFSTDDGYGGCNAKLDHHGRISLGEVPIKFGMVCGLPIEFEIVRRKDEA